MTTVEFRRFKNGHIPDTTVEVKGSVAIGGKSIPAAVAEYLVAYGLKQSVDDAGADPAKLLEGSKRRHAALMAGTVPAGGFGARVEPVFKTARDRVAALAKIKKPATIKDWAALNAVVKAKKLGEPAAVRAWAENMVRLHNVGFDKISD